MERLIKVAAVLLVCMVHLFTLSLPKVHANTSGDALNSVVCPPVQNTLLFTIVYGSVTIDGADAPPGSLVKAYSPRSDLVGCFAISTGGNYGAMYIYGEDTSVTPAIPGMRVGEIINFTINDLPATSSPTLSFQSDKDLHALNLSSAGISANYSASPTSGVAPLPVTFSDESTGSITAWSWDFGDGETSNIQNPQHIYNTPGDYTISLTVSGPSGSDFETKTSYITVYAGVSAGFMVDHTSGIAPLTASFTNQSSGDYSSLLWNFGDGVTSTATNPSHIYTSSGSYTVSLTASGNGGTDVETKTSYINVFDPVLASFTYAPDSGIAPLNVVFSNTSSGDYTSLIWNFGDGTTSSATNPSHTYTTKGTYTVTLTATGSGGTDAEIKSNAITVYAPVAASFSSSQVSGIAPLAITFSNNSSGDYTSSLWDFGDGNISTEANPMHVYTSKGIYSVNLTVSGPGGSNSQTRTEYITVYEPVTTNFSSDITSGVAPLTVHFTNFSTGDFSSLSWDFGDGMTSTEANPIHTYIAGGSYTVSLNATGQGGTDQEIKSEYITVHSPVTADFTFTPANGTAPLLVQFTNASSGDYSTLSWDFGDGSPINHETNPQHTFTHGGIYQVILTATGPGGDGLQNQTVTVMDPVQADFSADKTAGVVPLEVKFTNKTLGEYQTPSWDFGDGNSSAEVNPVHTYTAPGSYTITLTVSGNQGTDSETKIGYITVYETVDASFSASPTEGRAPLMVQFTNQSKGHTSQTWNFGDGGTSTETNPVHTYLSAGVYTVTLVVDGPGGTDMYVSQIHALPGFTLYLPVITR